MVQISRRNLLRTVAASLAAALIPRLPASLTAITPPPAGRLYVVAEKGPELLVPLRSIHCHVHGRVVSHADLADEIRRALHRGGGS